MPSPSTVADAPAHAGGCPAVLLLTVWLGIAMGWGVEAPSVGPPSDPAGAAFEELRAANLARDALSREWQAWQAENERTVALLDGLRDQVERLRADAAAAVEAAAGLEREIETAGAAKRRISELDQAFIAQTKAVGEALVAASARSVPGAVTVPRASSDPRGDFAAVVRALEGAERAASTSSVELVEGMLEGKVRAVTMLRLGGSGWWIEIDGQRAGTVRMAVGERLPVLDAIADPNGAEAIRHAVAIARSSRPPEVVALPLPSASIEVAP
jgi:hypothetical protein